MLTTGLAFFAERSWAERWRPGEGQAPEKVVPGREHEIGGDSPQIVEKPLAGHQFPLGRAPSPVAQVTDRMTGEGQQIEDREHGGQVLFAVPEIVLQVVAPGFQDIEAFVLDLPPCPATGGEVRDILPADIQVGDEAVPGRGSNLGYTSRSVDGTRSDGGTLIFQWWCENGSKRWRGGEIAGERS